MNKSVLRLVGSGLLAAGVLGITSIEGPGRTVMAIVVGIPSFVLMVVSRRQLGDSFSVNPEARKLVTAGLYSKIQHPMYLFMDLFLVAMIVLFDLPALLWLWGVLVVVQVLQSHREEKVLARAFGDAYEAYSRQTWV